MACKEEMCESTDIAMSIKKLQDVEKLKSMQIPFQKESPSWFEEDVHIINR